MKKLFSTLVVLMFFMSCSDDVKFNNPGLQAYRDDVLFKPLDVKAYQSASTGAIRIVAVAQDEELQLMATSSAKATYYFGTTNNLNKAIYNSNFSDVSLSYATTNAPGPVSKMSTNMTNVGSGYTADCTLQNGVWVCGTSHQTTTTGSGTGLTLSTITNSNGAVTSVKVASPGNNYAPGDLVTITGGGTINASVRVLNTTSSNGEIVITDNNGGLTGTFKFNAVQTSANPFANDLVNFQYGSFYKLPIIAEP